MTCAWSVGGLSGTIAALSAACKGARVVLIQDRPVLGDDRVLFEDCDNYFSFLRIPVSGLYRTVSVILDGAPAGESIRLYACEVK